MSQIHEKSPKHCAAKQSHFPAHKFNKKLFYSFSTLLLTILALILLVWLTLHPTKPQFSLKQTDIYQLNLSSFPHLLNSSIQVTLFSQNPNRKVGIYYDILEVYASYKGQQISLDTSIPPFYQGHEESNVLSASLLGEGLPVAPSFGYQVGRDKSTSGNLVISVKANGRLRWRVGSWVSGRYRFNVDCIAILPFSGSSLPTGPLTTKQGTQCSTAL
ncbi:OLC1v1020935C1 [Oldenlandia corymbosa var. corymbosa]|uniref:OLC1v1020935C1 n=1 Tax=Oldenlandia corymbosa var. corymbosa TaxID=529605 RepID=A0AAV1BY94_OLDCO|nr:OLC1v1020935C1 [Oldenlandia corymbosa var. corymbosa]